MIHSAKPSARFKNLMARCFLKFELIEYRACRMVILSIHIYRIRLLPFLDMALDAFVRISRCHVRVFLFYRTRARACNYFSKSDAIYINNLYGLIIALCEKIRIPS